MVWSVVYGDLSCVWTTQYWYNTKLKSEPLSVSVNDDTYIIVTPFKHNHSNILLGRGISISIIIKIGLFFIIFSATLWPSRRTDSQSHQVDSLIRITLSHVTNYYSDVTTHHVLFIFIIDIDLSYIRMIVRNPYY